MADTPTDETEQPAAPAPAEPRSDGVAMQGSYPLNHRLRAEALANEGKADDPDGMITSALIADAKDRLAAEAADVAAAETARASAVRDVKALTKPELVEHAAEQGITIDQNATKATILDTVLAHGAPAGSEG